MRPIPRGLRTPENRNRPNCRKNARNAPVRAGLNAARSDVVWRPVRAKPMVRTIGLRSDEPDHEPARNPETTPKSAETSRGRHIAPETHVDTYSGKSLHERVRDERFRKTGLHASTRQNVSTPSSTLLTTDAQLADRPPGPPRRRCPRARCGNHRSRSPPRSLRLVQLATRERVYLIDPATRRSRRPDAAPDDRQVDDRRPQPGL